MIRAFAVVTALALGMAPGHVALAQPTTTQVYKVKQKDTLDVIAAEYYGDRAHATFIIAENKLKNGRVQPYTRLRIPVTREITTAKGETFTTLAAAYLGDERRAPFLADFNALPVDDSLATGSAITIPFHIGHTAEATESLASIAARYYGDSKQADLLKRYNFLDKNTIEKGEQIFVPVLDVRVRATKLPPLDTEAKDRRRQVQKIAEATASALPAARAAYLQGDFAHVRALLEPFADQLEYMDSATAIAVGLLLGKAHLAFGNTDAAVAAFKQIRERKPSHKLTHYSDSPKVIDAWKQAGGLVQE
jgi:LysM repeat protein